MIDKYKYLNVVKDWQIFLKIIKKLKSYLVEFEKNGFMKTKDYTDDCAVVNNKRQLIIIITHYNCTFFANE